MAQIVTNKAIADRCNIQAIQSGGSKAVTILQQGEVWLVDTSNTEKTGGFGKYDSYIIGDGVTQAQELTLNEIDSEKQDVLVFDSEPTENSGNPVTSSGIKEALDLKSNSEDVYTKEEIDTMFDPASPPRIVIVSDLPQPEVAEYNVIYRMPNEDGSGYVDWVFTGDNTTPFTKLADIEYDGGTLFHSLTSLAGKTEAQKEEMIPDGNVVEEVMEEAAKGNKTMVYEYSYRVLVENGGGTASWGTNKAASQYGGLTDATSPTKIILRDLSSVTTPTNTTIKMLASDSNLKVIGTYSVEWKGDRVIDIRDLHIYVPIGGYFAIQQDTVASSTYFFLAKNSPAVKSWGYNAEIGDTGGTSSGYYPTCDVEYGIISADKLMVTKVMDDGEILNGKAEDYSTKNLIKRGMVFTEGKQINSSGSLINLSTGAASPFISCEGLSKLRFNIQHSNTPVVFYNASRTVLSYVPSKSSTANESWFSVTVPENAVYFRYTTVRTEYQNSNVIVYNDDDYMAHDDSLHYVPRSSNPITYGYNLLDRIGYFDKCYINGNKLYTSNANSVATDLISVVGIKRLYVSGIIFYASNWGVFLNASGTAISKSIPESAGFNPRPDKDYIIIDVPNGAASVQINLDRTKYLAGKSFVCDVDKLSEIYYPLMEWAKKDDELYGKTVVLLGDSYSSGGTPTWLGADKHWFNILADYYHWNATIWATDGAPYAYVDYDPNVLNPSRCIVRYVDNIANMAVKPDIIMVWGGHNDASLSRYGNFDNISEIDESGGIPTYADIRSLCGALRYVCEAAHTYAPCAKIFLFSRAFCAGFNPLNHMAKSPEYYSADINVAIQRAAMMFCATYIDMNASGYHQWNTKTTDPNSLSGDGIHPSTDRGGRQIAEYLKRELPRKYVLGLTQIEGVVTDGESPVTGVTITFTRNNNGLSWTCTTDDSGKYICRVDAGDYTISISGRTLDVDKLTIKQSTVQNIVATANE